MACGSRKVVRRFFYDDLTPLFLYILSAHHAATLSWFSTLLCALYSVSDIICHLTTTLNIKLLITDVRISEVTVPQLRPLTVLAFKTSPIQKK